MELLFEGLIFAFGVVLGWTGARLALARVLDLAFGRRRS